MVDYTELGSIDSHTFLVAHCAAALVPLVSHTIPAPIDTDRAKDALAKALQAAEEAVAEYEEGQRHR